MRKIVLALLATTGPGLAQDLPAGAELSMFEGSGVSVETDEVKFRVQPTDDEVRFQVFATLKADGRERSLIWDAGGPLPPDRLFVEESRVCDRRFFDLILRMPPPRYGDIGRFTYSRLIFTEDLELVASASDDTVEVANAVLPLHFFTEPGRYHDRPDFVVTCKDGIPLLPDAF